MLTHVRSPEDCRAVLAISWQKIERLSALAERLLFLTRHDDGQDGLVFASINLTDLMSTVLAAHSAPLPKKNLCLEFIPPEDSVAVEGDNEEFLLVGVKH